MPPDYLYALARICHAERYISGEDILLQGENTTRFFIVDEGYVNLTTTDRDGFEQAVGSKGPGDYFGVKMFTTQEPSEVTAVAVGAVQLYVMDRENLDKLLDQAPGLLDLMPEVREEKKQLTRGLTWLASGEVVRVFTRPHWWLLVLRERLPLLFLLLILIASIAAYQFGLFQMVEFAGWVLGLVMFVGVVWGIWNLLNYLDDHYIVTNKRVVAVNQMVYLSDSRVEIPLDKIQSISVEGGGPIARALGIWTLQIKSAAVNQEGVVFEGVADAERIREAIARQQTALTARSRAADREKFRRHISRELRHYILPGEEPPTQPKSPPRPSLTVRHRLTSMWNRLFGIEFREGNVITWRKHPVVLIRQVLPYLLATVVLVVMTVGVTLIGVPPMIPAGGFYLLMGVLILVAFGLAVWQWDDWRHDLYQVSDAEIVDIESLPLGLNYHAKHASISNVQDVSMARPHYINTFLNYGNVDAKVAGDNQPFTFKSVARPSDVAAEIFRRIQAFKVKQRDRETSIQSRQIVDALVAYHRLLVTERTQNPPPQVVIGAPTNPPPPVPAPANPPAPAPVPAPVVATPNEPQAVDDGREFPPEDESTEL